MTLLCGFLVVRLPEFAFHEYHRKTPELDGRIYRGVDRLPWDWGDVPDPRKSTMRALAKKVERHFFGEIVMDTSPDFPVAREFLSHDPKRNEIVAVHSASLPLIGPEFDIAGRLEFLGYELFAPGEWSPHEAGIFRKPSHFKEFVDVLNENGLFDTDDLCAPLAARYQELSRAGIVEPLADDPYFVHLGVFRVPQ